MYTVIIGFVIANIVPSVMRFVSSTSSHSKIFKVEAAPVYFMFQTLLYFAVYSILSVKTSYKLINTLIFCSTFSYLVLILITNIMDLELSIETLQRFSNYFITAYLVKSSPPSENTSDVIGQTMQSNFGQNVLQVIAAVARTPVHSSLIFGGIVLGIVVGVVLAVKRSHGYRKIDLTDGDDQVKTKFRWLTVAKMASVLGLITAFTVFIITDSQFLDQSVPPHWYFYKTAFPSRKPEKYLESVGIWREQSQTKEFFLDQRSLPQYPLVIGNLSYYCSYNKCGSQQLMQLKQQMTMNEENSRNPQTLLEQQMQEQPDVVIILVESFSPSPLMITNDVARSGKNVVIGPAYKDFYLPNMAKLNNNGIAFTALSSLGIPTISAWHAFMTGELPTTNFNQISSIYNDVDDFPSIFKQLKYNTLYVGSSPFSYDGETNWLYRGRNTVSNFSRFPTWFDKIIQYFPTQNQALMLNVSLPQQKRWVPDRITKQQFIQQFTKLQQPRMGMWATVDTHMPFTGQDDMKEYNDYEIGQGITTNFDDNAIQDKYATVVGYADHYIGELVGQIVAQNSNTIIVILGDHGAREIPISNPVDKFDSDSLPYDESCRNGGFGDDSIFDTSGMILYFGSNSRVKSNLDPVRGMVSKAPADHNDLVQTVLDLVSTDQPPHSRIGVNLLDLAKALMEERPVNDPMPIKLKISLRVSGIIQEAVIDNKLIRIGTSAEEFEPAWPTCLGTKHQNAQQAVVSKVYNLRQMFNYLQDKNQIFSYSFRNATCQYPVRCEFPTPAKGFYANVAGCVVAVVIGVGLAVGFLWYMAVRIFGK